MGRNSHYFLDGKSILRLARWLNSADIILIEIAIGAVILASIDDWKHDLLLIIVTVLFVRFSLGLEAQGQVSPTIVVPPAG